MHNCAGPIHGKISHIIVNGSSTGDYKLPIASESTLGGVKVGEDLSITEDGAIYVNIESLAEKLFSEVKDKYYEHRQNAVSKIWKINHNLNKKPSVTVVDSAGSEVIGEVIYIDDNNLELHFSAQFSGIAYLN